VDDEDEVDVDDGDELETVEEAEELDEVLLDEDEETRLELLVDELDRVLELDTVLELEAVVTVNIRQYLRDIQYTPEMGTNLGYLSKTKKTRLRLRLRLRLNSKGL